MKEKTLYIEKFVYKGYGLAHDKKTYLVKNALPGETVKVMVINEKKDIVYARATEIIDKNEERLTHPCPYYNKCGGCSIPFVNYSYELELKKNICKELLNEFNVKHIKVIPSKKQTSYRARIKMHTSIVPLSVGFKKQYTNEIINVKTCFQTTFKVMNVVNLLKGRLFSFVESIYNNYTNKGNIKELSFTNIGGSVIVGILSQHGIKKTFYNDIMDRFKFVKGIVRIERKKNITTLKEILKGEKQIHTKISNIYYDFNATSFIQPNTTLHADFLSLISNLSETEKSKRIVDLYGGSGFFSTFLANKGFHLTLVEKDPSAITLAEENKKNNNTNYNIIKAYAENVIGRLNYDTIILDPPRKGVNIQVLKSITKQKPKNIIFISCHPSTLVRDLKILTNHGYKIKYVYLLDNFPLTYHMECILFLKNP